MKCFIQYLRISYFHVPLRLVFFLFFYFQSISSLSNERKLKLEASRCLHAFYQEWEEADIFIKEKEREAVSKDVGRDLVSLTRLLKKHEVCKEIGHIYF